MNKQKRAWPLATARNGAVALLAAWLGAGCAPLSPAPPDSGIDIHGLHLSAHGYVLDMRYRVRDQARAAALLDAKKKITLIDDARHAQLGVPESPVIGGMRQSARNHVIYTDRDYFILFVNPGRAVRVGDRLQLAVDGRKIAQLTVE